MENVSSKNVSLEYDSNVYNSEKIKSEFIDELIARNVIPTNCTKIIKDEHIVSYSESNDNSITTKTVETIRNEVIIDYEVEPDYNAQRDNKAPWTKLFLMTEKKINYDKSIELVKISSEYTTFYMDKLNSLKAGFMFCYIFGGLISAFAIFFYLIAEDPGTSELIIPGSGLLLITMGILLHLKYKGKSYQRKKAEPLRTALAEMASVFYDVVKKLELLKCTYFHKDLIPVSKKSEEDFTIPLSSFSHEEFVQNMVLRLNDKTFIDGSLMGWSFKCK